MPSAAKKASVIIPAYKEEEGLPVVLEKLFNVLDDSYEVIVVDDGSPDGTAERASAFPCRLIRHEQNRGKGEAMRTGVGQAQSENIIFIDADGTYPVEAIPDISAQLQDFDMVVAARTGGRQNIPRFNRIGNFIFTRLLCYVHGYKLTDPLSGLYGIKKAHFERMQLYSRGFTVETEIAIKASRMKLKLAEIPVEYAPRLGQQKLGGIRHGWQILKTILGEKIRPTAPTSSSRTLKIAIVGSRGIPAKYGGAETLAEELAVRLTGQGFQVYVTCESRSFHKDTCDGVVRIHSPSIQGKTLTVPSVNDIVSTLHLLLRCRRVGLIYYLAPDSALAALIPRFLGKKVIVNTDGIEWKRLTIRRPYFSPAWKPLSLLVSRYLKWMEWLSVKVSHAVIADSKEIQKYLKETYRAKNAVYISYGARQLLDRDITAEREREVLDSVGLSPGEYYLTVGRIVAENNIHREIEGFKRARSSKNLVIVGNFNPKDRYTRYLLGLRGDDPGIMLLDPIYDKEVLGILRKNCYAYIHAYEVGGTNPSLLEQMPFGKPVLAYDVPFHREVLQDGGIYFADEDGLARCIAMLEGGEIDLAQTKTCQGRRIEDEYNWDHVTQKYASLFKEFL
jgi:rhamnosyltransferase